MEQDNLPSTSAWAQTEIQLISSKVQDMLIKKKMQNKTLLVSVKLLIYIGAVQLKLIKPKASNKRNQPHHHIIPINTWRKRL